MAAQHIKPWKPHDSKIKQFLAQLPPLKPLDGSTKRFLLLVLCGPSLTAKTLMARLVGCGTDVDRELQGHDAPEPAGLRFAKVHCVG